MLCLCPLSIDLLLALLGHAPTLVLRLPLPIAESSVSCVFVLIPTFLLATPHDTVDSEQPGTDLCFVLLYV